MHAGGVSEPIIQIITDEVTDHSRSSRTVPIFEAVSRTPRIRNIIIHLKYIQYMYVSDLCQACPGEKTHHNTV